MATTFDVLQVGDRFRFRDKEPQWPTGLMVKTGPGVYRRQTEAENSGAFGPDVAERVWVEWVEPERCSHGMGFNCSTCWGGPADKPEPKAPRYTVGRRDSGIMKDGKLWLAAGTVHGADMPGGIGALMQRIADLLNQHGEG